MLSTRYIVCYLTQVVWQPLFCCAPLPSWRGNIPKKKLEIENKLNGNSNLNHSMVKADVKQSRYIVSKCSIIASIIKVVTNSTKNHNCPDQKPELFNTNHQWPQILGFLRYKSLNTDRFANIENQKIKNKTKKTFQSQRDDTRSLYGWMVKVRSDWAWLVHRWVPRDQLALFVEEKRGRFLNVGNNFWKGITKAEEEGEEKMVRWKEKERRRRTPPAMPTPRIPFTFPYLAAVIKNPNTHTHTHSPTHTHTTHTRTHEGGRRGGKGGESAGREYIGKGEWKITAPAKGPRPKSLLPIELCVCVLCVYAWVKKKKKNLKKMTK